jgi:hypothetical protein
MEKWRCNYCGAKFTTLKGAEAHVAKRHAKGALWIEKNVAVWPGEYGIGKYDVQCLIHLDGTDFPTKRLAMKWCRVDSAEWCEGCQEDAMAEVN